MLTIHPTAVVEKSATLEEGVVVEALSYVGEGAKIGKNSRIEVGAQVLGSVIAGEDNVFGRNSVIGAEPQDLGFDKKAKTQVRIGNGNTFREYVTIHRSTVDEGATTIGDKNFLMVGTHLGHDVILGNENIFANNVMIAGFVTIGNQCFFGGGAGLHQQLRVGDLSMIQGHASCSQDVPPFSTVMLLNRIAGLNVVGLRRAGFEKEERSELKEAFDLLFRGDKIFTQQLEIATAKEWSGPAKELIGFCNEKSIKGIISRIGKD